MTRPLFGSHVRTVSALVLVCVCCTEEPDTDVVGAMRASLERCGPGAFEHAKNVELEPELVRRLHQQRVEAIVEELALRISTTQVRFHLGQYAPSCVKQIEELDCARMVDGLVGLFAPGRACRDMLEGKSALGERCIFDTDCADTAHVCSSRKNDLLPGSGGTSCGLCVRAGELGEPCGPDADGEWVGCAAGARCQWDRDPVAPTTRCEAVAAPDAWMPTDSTAAFFGDTCAESSAYCVDTQTRARCDEETLVCTSRPFLDEPCDRRDPLSCDRREAWCAPNESGEGENEPPPTGGRCIAVRGVGQSCSGTWECRAGLFCASDGCRPTYDGAVDCPILLGE